jgi:hypothetical protein
MFQDGLLKQLVEEYSEKWDYISLHFPDRSDIQCQQRWQKVVNPELVKGPWTKEVRCNYANSGLLQLLQSYPFSNHDKHHSVWSVRGGGVDISFTLTHLVALQDSHNIVDCSSLLLSLSL